MFDFFDLTRLLYMTPAVIIGLSFHEFAHAAVAHRLGDRTAQHLGRLTLNPAAHIDILGLIMLYFAGFGWAKPVPVNPANFKGDWNRGMLLVSLAGPVSNFILAILSTILLAAFLHDIPYIGVMTQYLISINVVLAVFNLLPLPPLDGSKILAGLVPSSRRWLDSVEQYGTIVLILLLFTGVIGRLLGVLINPINSFLSWIAGIVGALF